MANSKLYVFLKSLQDIFTTCRLDQSEIVDKSTQYNSENFEIKKCALEGASYDLVKNLEPNKNTLENANYILIKNMQANIEESHDSTVKQSRKNILDNLDHDLLREEIELLHNQSREKRLCIK